MEAYRHLYAISLYDMPGADYYDRSDYDKLGSTPLTETAIVAEKLVNAFQDRYNIEKTNVIFLTDGIADNLRFGYDKNENVSTNSYGKKYIKVGRKTLSYDNLENAYPTVLRHLAKETGAKTIGFFLYSGPADIAYAFEGVSMPKVDSRREMLKKLKKEGVLHYSKTAGYDDYFIIKINEGSTTTETFAEQDVKDAKSIKRRFKSFNSGRKKSRQIVNKITDAVAA